MNPAMKLIPRARSVLLTIYLVTAAHTETLDLIIRHGRVVDGTGSPAYFADVAVSDGRIAAIGKIKDKAKEEIEASGLVVAPGFIDVHTHAENIDTLPLAENFARMGVTSPVPGAGRASGAAPPAPSAVSLGSDFICVRA